jgi:hypothetical protein
MSDMRGETGAEKLRRRGERGAEKSSIDGGVFSPSTPPFFYV